MLFREFNIIAAAAYAAEQAAVELVHGVNPLAVEWGNLTETEQMEQTQRVMAIARGDVADAEIGKLVDANVFGATARAILNYNGGQGGLALEKIAAIGGDHFNLGLVTEDQVAGRDIADVNSQLLQELAGLRMLLSAFGQAALRYVPPTTAEPDPEPTAEQVAEELEDSTVQ